MQGGVGWRLGAILATNGHFERPDRGHTVGNRRLSRAELLRW